MAKATNVDKIRQVGRLQGKLMAEHYERALNAKKDGKPVVYVTAMFPVEIVKAFEPHVTTVYPENHAVLLIARGQDQFVGRAEGAGVDRLGCAYELYNTGYFLSGQGQLDSQDLVDQRGRAVPKLPEPDVLLACDNQCRVICEWFKHLSEIAGDKPYKMINVGDRYDGLLGEERTSYIRKQLDDVIRLLEEVTGTKLDRDKLLEVAEKSRSALQLWQTYLDMGVMIPSPMTAFDGFYHMSLIVSERGKQQAIDYYQLLVEATQELADNKISAVGNERRRLLWDNLATWYNFREIKEYLAERNIAVVGSTYLDAWRKELDTFGYDALMDSAARTYGHMYTNMTIPDRIQLYIDSINKYKADGVLFHKNLSCHTYSLRVDEIAEKLEQHFGPEFKTVVFEGCQGISGRFQKYAFEMGVNVHFFEQ